MIIGNKSKFALESEITQAYECLSVRALGYFLIYIGGKSYGVKLPDATMLACSFNEVKERIIRRGSHIAPFATEPNANEIADAVHTSLYVEDQENVCFFGMSCSELSDIVYSNKLLWAPDGDEAFDDSSRVLHFDVENRVRLIGFKLDINIDRKYHSIVDIWIDADVFYSILLNWHNAFESEWIARSQVARRLG